MSAAPPGVHEVAAALVSALHLRDRIARAGTMSAALLMAEWGGGCERAREARDPWVLVRRMRELLA